MTSGSGANSKSEGYSPQTRLWRTRTQMLNIDDLFKGHHFDRGIIILCVRCPGISAAWRRPTPSVGEVGLARQAFYPVSPRLAVLGRPRQAAGEATQSALQFAQRCEARRSDHG